MVMVYVDVGRPGVGISKGRKSLRSRKCIVSIVGRLDRATMHLANSIVTGVTFAHFFEFCAYTTVDNNNVTM